jgi:hypothetical protein
MFDDALYVTIKPAAAPPTAAYLSIPYNFRVSIGLKSDV